MPRHGQQIWDSGSLLRALTFPQFAACCTRCTPFPPASFPKGANEGANPAQGTAGPSNRPAPMPRPCQPPALLPATSLRECWGHGALGTSSHKGRTEPSPQPRKEALEGCEASAVPEGAKERGGQGLGGSCLHRPVPCSGQQSQRVISPQAGTHTRNQSHSCLAPELEQDCYRRSLALGTEQWLPASRALELGSAVSALGAQSSSSSPERRTQLCSDKPDHLARALPAAARASVPRPRAPGQQRRRGKQSSCSPGEGSH